MNPETCPSCHQPLPANAPAGLCPACVMRAAFASGPAATGPSVAELQAAFPQLEILECIGRGGMGIVYKARQPHLDRFVALKILAPGLQADPGFAERFTREARTLAKLTHPNLVAVHDFGESGGFYYLLMEYVDGVNLRQAMRAARFTPEQALGLIPDLCAALQFAHDHGVLHRDIKPENILIDTKGRVKIADFGIARLLAEDPQDLALTLTGAALGSAAYMAPEQIEHPEDVDHRADIYSLGVVFYEMLTGGLPLGRFPAPSEKSTSDPRLDEVVFRALEKERDRRYQSAADVRVGVEGHATMQPSPPRTPMSPLVGESAPPPKSDKTPHYLFFGGLGVICFLLLVVPVTYVGQIWSKIVPWGSLASEDPESYASFADASATPASLQWLNPALLLALVSMGAGVVLWLRRPSSLTRERLPSAAPRRLRPFVAWLLVAFTAYYAITRFSRYTADEPLRPLFAVLCFCSVYAMSRGIFYLTGVSPFALTRWRSLKWIAAGCSLLLMIAAAVMAWHLGSERLGRDYFRTEAVIPLRISFQDGVPSVQFKTAVNDAAALAAGPYVDQIRPNYDGGLLNAAFVLPVDSSATNISAVFYQRFRASLPLELLSNLGPLGANSDDDKDATSAAIDGYRWIIVLSVLAAVLAAGCGYPAGMVPITIGAVTAGVLTFIPPPPLPTELKERVIVGVELPSISDPTPADFTTPSNAAASFYRAAFSSNAEAFQECLSKRARAYYDRKLLSRLARRNWKVKTIEELPEYGDPLARRLKIETSGGVHVMEVTLEKAGWKLVSIRDAERTPILGGS